MSLWRQLERGVRSLLDREAADRDIAEEVQHYLDEATAALIADGLPVDEARRRARLELGPEVAIREEVRSYGWENVLDAVVGDVRLGARRLRKSPGFTALSVLTLAVGIGATTAIFSVARPILFESLPYPNADRLVAISDRGPDGSPIDVTFGSYRELADRSRSFEALAVLRPWQPTLTGAGAAERLPGQKVSGDYFRVLGVRPVLGRPFDPADDRLGGPAEVILAHSLWRSRFGGDRGILGREITLDDEPHTVIGVMGPDFENLLAPSARVWSLLQYDASLGSFEGREWGHHLRMVGRLQSGVERGGASRELDGIAALPVAEFPRPRWSTLEHGLDVAPLEEEITGAAKPGLVALLAAVGLLLLIAGVNLTNLLLGRGVQRRGELSMRAALGARRSRLIQQLLTESLLLALLGGAVGIALGAVGVELLIALSPPELPRLSAVRLDGTVFAVTLGITTVVGVAVGLIPALDGSRGDPQGGLRRGSNRMTGGHEVARSALVVAEVSLTLVLLIGAGLLVRSLDRLFAIDPGFQASPVIALQVQASGREFEDAAATGRFFTAATEAVRNVPGVASAAVTSQLPLSGEVDEYGVQAESIGLVDPGEGGGALRYAVSPGYFGTLGIPLQRGRLLRERDTREAPPAVVISESLARRLFPGDDPIGRKLHVGRTDLPSYTVVGVVGDVKQTSLSSDQTDAAYITPGQWYFGDRAMWVVVRVAEDAASMVPSLRAAIGSVDANQPIVRATTMAELLVASAAERRFALRLFGAFAIAALVLAMIGLYGVVSGGVAERMREMGVRRALGATRGDLLALVIRRGLALTGIGVLLGLAGAVAMSRALATLLYDISPVDPITYLGVVLLMAAIAASACAVPAWRAARVDASTALRLE